MKDTNKAVMSQHEVSYVISLFLTLWGCDYLTQ